MSFDQSFPKVIKVEGGDSDNKNDSGGKTRFGITQAVASMHGFDDVSKLTIQQAKSIYKSDYWDLLHLDNIDLLSDKIAFELFDTAVNMGVGTSGIFLQRALNSLNDQQRYFPDLKVDGIIGAKTIYALTIYKGVRQQKGVNVLLKILNSLQCVRYVELTEKREKDEDFLYGWVTNRVNMP
uniref:Uncharacterized protein n=1 Tax=Hydrogenovibrio crunogenus (strain DSM 25203 / XCL-2) TaxID=317025 RepID=Q31HV3_HYDCU